MSIPKCRVRAVAEGPLRPRRDLERPRAPLHEVHGQVEHAALRRRLHTQHTVTQEDSRGFLAFVPNVTSVNVYDCPKAEIVHCLSHFVKITKNEWETCQIYGEIIIYVYVCVSILQTQIAVRWHDKTFFEWMGEKMGNRWGWRMSQGINELNRPQCLVWPVRPVVPFPVRHSASPPGIERRGCLSVSLPGVSQYNMSRYDSCATSIMWR